nr:hypothetical protein [Tanacetum cinerariifolium]
MSLLFPVRREEVLDFLRFLGHSDGIRYLTDVNINKLYQPWRSFSSVINKCLTGKSSGVDSFRLSQAQMLWGFYHRINIDFAYLIWEDFVYQWGVGCSGEDGGEGAMKSGGRNRSKSNDDMLRKYTHSNTIQHAECFKQKMLLVQPQEAGIQLSKDQLAILADTGERIDFGPCAFIVTTNALFQADGVEVYDSDCDDVPNSQPSFMANISSNGSYALAEVHNPDNMDNNMINQGVQVKSSSEQSSVVSHSETEITSDSNIIPYS